MNLLERIELMNYVCDSYLHDDFDCNWYLNPLQKWLLLLKAQICIFFDLYYEPDLSAETFCVACFGGGHISATPANPSGAWWEEVRISWQGPWFYYLCHEQSF